MLSLVSSSSLGLQLGSQPAAVSSRSAASSIAMNLGRPIRVAVIGGGPSGACAAEIFAQAPNIECTLFERKMDNAKPCGGAIPLCMVDEFKLPPEIIDRRVRKMKMISPSGREVDVGRTLNEDEYIGMTRREVLDGYLRDRAVELGAKPVTGLVQKVEFEDANGPYTIKYSEYKPGEKKGTPSEAEFD